MDALGSLSPLDLVEGKVQEKVARFLALKPVINKLRMSPQINISSKAEGLAVTQGQIEGELPTILDKIKRFKEQPYLMGTIAEIAGFATRMLKQINQVDDLRIQAENDGAMPEEDFDIAGMLGNPMVLGAAAIALFFFLKR